MIIGRISPPKSCHSGGSHASAICEWGVYAKLGGSGDGRAAGPCAAGVPPSSRLEWAAEIDPPLTTIQVPTYDMGVAAADYLIGELTGAPVPRHTNIETNFILRGSTGPAPGR